VAQYNTKFNRGDKAYSILGNDKCVHKITIVNLYEDKFGITISYETEEYGCIKEVDLFTKEEANEKVAELLKAFRAKEAEKVEEDIWVQQVIIANAQTEISKLQKKKPNGQ